MAKYPIFYGLELHLQHQAQFFRIHFIYRRFGTLRRLLDVYRMGRIDFTSV